MTVEHEVRARIAERYADLVDRASVAGDGPGLLRAGDKLVELLDVLPVRVGGVTASDGDGKRAAIFELYHGEPTVVDGADG